MLASDPEHPGTLPVQQMRAGDHAFLCYDDHLQGWDVLSAFVWTGLARGEKVIVFPDPRLNAADVLRHLNDVPGVLLAQGYDSGRLELNSMRQLILPDRTFTAAQQWRRIVEETESAQARGFTGLRTYIDMGWVADLEADLNVMMARERQAEHLFTTGLYSEICAYERDRFPQQVLEAMCQAHPQNLLPALGHLRARQTDNTLWLVGEADLATREQFTHALAEAARSPVTRRGLTIDLCGVVFLGVECARELIRMMDRTTAHRPVRVRCTGSVALVLRRLGADPAVIDVAQVKGS
ncbi:MEDS domain-containing protein [Streptomyces sp. TRM66268-LWL]|uniref:MEDS domain-containing protein n=1 Tax=Streptomyces polyasparticus TaxID=2767826 RepID=A0ABR7SWF2_9ACTN|nr:MEDS domain-containing protein [Streptomyces polyasparticus]MBC9719267.1 MEDS domain-containing protein [Streptomyces polyasparticus]